MEARQVEEMIGDAEVKLERLRSLYEQYFQGIERIEPQIPKKNFDRTLAVLFRMQTRNTALRFRMQNLRQRYTTLKTYWTRVVRQIEEGTYRPHVLKARRQRLTTDSLRVEEGSTRPTSLSPKASRAPNGASSVGKTGLSESELRKLHTNFETAQVSANTGKTLRYESLVKKIEAVMPKLREKHGNKAITFDVVVKNGKVGLKAIPRRPRQQVEAAKKPQPPQVPSAGKTGSAKKAVTKIAAAKQPPKRPASIEQPPKPRPPKKQPPPLRVPNTNR